MFHLKLYGNLTNNNDRTLMNDTPRKPLYLAALTANNSPGETWGPRRRIHQYGPYAHLLAKSTKNNIPSQQRDVEQVSVTVNGTGSTKSITNPSFDPDSTINYDDESYRTVRF